MPELSVCRCHSNWTSSGTSTQQIGKLTEPKLVSFKLVSLLSHWEQKLLTSDDIWVCLKIWYASPTSTDHYHFHHFFQICSVKVGQNGDTCSHVFPNISTQKIQTSPFSPRLCILWSHANLGWLLRPDFQLHRRNVRQRQAKLIQLAIDALEAGFLIRISDDHHGNVGGKHDQ